MKDQDLTLKFEIYPDLSPEVESVTDAIDAWADILRTAAAIIDPNATMTVKLIGVESGSQVFFFALERLEAFGQRVQAGGQRYPFVYQAVMSLSALIGGTVAVAGITNAVTPDPRIPEDQMQVFKEMNEHLGESVELQRKNQRFFDRLSREPAFEAIKVIRDDGVVVYEVPQSEFLNRSGLWSGDAADAKPRIEPRFAVWDVTLIKPAMVAKPRRWTFSRDGLEFSAKMEDPAVLAAIRSGTLRIQIVEGVRLKVEVLWNERFDGNVWTPLPATRRIRRVLRPLPPPPSVPLFPTSSDP